MSRQRRGLIGHGKRAMIGDYVRIERGGQPLVQGVLLRVEVQDHITTGSLAAGLFPIDILVQQEPLRHQGPTSFFLDRSDRVTFVDREFLDGMIRIAGDRGRP